MDEPAPQPAPAKVVVRGLVKEYDDFQRGKVRAVDGLSFEAHAGEIMGLLGPNGAGKTTALRILATLLQPTEGVTLVNGFDCHTQPELVRRQIGFISANTAVYDRMTAYEFVEYFGKLHGLGGVELEDRINRLFDQLEMQPMRDTLGAKMSTGMKQRASIARALIHDPPVLIFDEATNGLDVLAARAVLDTVSRLREQGKCLIFSTHIMREVERLCDSVAIVHRGKILTQGTIADLEDQHQENDLEEMFFRLIRDAEAADSSAEAALA